MTMKEAFKYSEALKVIRDYAVPRFPKGIKTSTWEESMKLMVEVFEKQIPYVLENGKCKCGKFETNSKEMKYCPICGQRVIIHE